MLDQMAHRHRQEVHAEMTVPCVDDRISALPEDLLHRLLSFLTAREVVQTCVLSRRWQRVWASVSRLDVDAAKFTNLEQFKKFVDNLLQRRADAALHRLWLRVVFDHRGEQLLSSSEISPWVTYALGKRTQVLGIVNDVDRLDDKPLCVGAGFASIYLKRLHLCYFEIDDSFCVMLSAGCPALEELELIYCCISDTTFSSTTLKRLAVSSPNYPDLHFWEFEDLVINMPNLVYLYIEELIDRNPYLLDVSSLQTASIDISASSFRDSDVRCNVISALSRVSSLESLSLTVHDDEAIKVMASDVLRIRGTFSNLSTLSLGEWCFSNGCMSLLFLLRRSPNIKKLILHLSNYGASLYDHPKQTDPSGNGAEKPFSCKKLKEIEINCPPGDKRVLTIGRILFANIISPPKIHIKTFM